MNEQNINRIELAGRARNVCVCACVCVGMCVGAFVLADVSLFPLCHWTERGRRGHAMCLCSCVC